MTAEPPSKLGTVQAIVIEFDDALESVGEVIFEGTLEANKVRVDFDPSPALLTELTDIVYALPTLRLLSVYLTTLDVVLPSYYKTLSR